MPIHKTIGISFPLQPKSEYMAGRQTRRGRSLKIILSVRAVGME